MNLLVVGTGFGRQWVVNAMLAEHWKPAGVVARTERSLERAARDLSLSRDQTFKSITEALEALPEVDAVAVATPNDSHLPLALEVLRHGKHLILEKPIVVDLAEAEALFREIAAHPELKVMVGQTMRGDPLLRAVRDAVASGIVGEVEMVVMRAIQRWVGDPEKAWRYKLADLMLDDIGIHQIDALRMLLGERRCEEIFARVFNPRWYPLPTRTTCSALLEMEGGIEVNYFSTLAATGSNTRWVGDFDILGSEGSIFTRRDSAHAVLEENPKERVPIEPKDPDDYQGLAYLLEDFYSAILEDRSPITGIRNNLHSFNVVQAAKLSAEMRRPVNLREEILEDWMPR
ncbi:MAG: Gfo/Idh/MocA family protein [Promethearchaeota archaeon]